MLMRCVKAYSTNCLSLSPAISSQFTLEVRGTAEDCKKTIKTPYFGSSRSFKVIDVDTTKKLITSACCHRHAYLQPLSC